MIILLSSCKKNTQESVTPVNNQTTISYLSFKDFEAYTNKQISNLNLTNKERLQLEKEQGFTSMKTVYNEFDDKLYEMGQKKDTTGFAQLKSEMGAVVHWYEDNDHIVNCTSDIEATVVNRDGLVKIGDSLYVFRKDKIAVIKNNDASLVVKIEKINRNYEDGDVRILYNNNADGARSSINSKNFRYMVPGDYPNGGQSTIQQIVLQNSSGSVRLRGQMTLVNQYVNGNNRGYALLTFAGEERVIPLIWTKAIPSSMTVTGDLLVGLTKKADQTTDYNIQRLVYNLYTPLDQIRTADDWTGGIMLAISNYYMVTFTGPTRYIPQLNTSSAPFLGTQQYMLNDDYLGAAGYWEYVSSEQGPNVPVPEKPITPITIFGAIKTTSISLTFN
ncbi:hypothetical protein GCM10022209_20620 [Chitinophaga oryziterrae]